MAIDYVTDIRSLYIADVRDDADYGIETLGGGGTIICPDCKVETARVDHVSEQDILTTMAVVEAHIRLLRDRDEARVLHYALSRLLKGIGSGGFVFEDLGIDVVASKPNPVFAPTDEIEVLDAAGSPVIAAFAVGGTGTLADLVNTFNTTGAAALPAAGITASINRGRLQISMDDGSLASSPPPPAVGRRFAPGFGIGTGGANTNVARIAGLEFGQYKNRLDVLADRLRDDALDFFQKERREDDLEDYFRRDPQRG